MGDPAGIGGEIALKAWLRRAADDLPPFFVIDDPERLAAVAARLRLSLPIEVLAAPAATNAVFPRALPVLPLSLATPPVPGCPDPANAPMIREAIERAVALVRMGKASAVVTNPIAKQVLYAAGFTFPGHTEFLAELAGIVTPPVMMLACPGLRVIPVTIHVALRQAIENLTAGLIVETARIAAEGLRRDFGIHAPRLAVAGLNPHAGEGGGMGREDIDIVQPAIDALRAQGIDAFGPLPSDTLFTPSARAGYDVALCMYHDQALIPLKTLGFDQGVNVTLGLPFVRTSPDHGTAFDIAGTGTASESSLIAALRMAAQMVAARG
ncbi:MAG: 4-hydroxythreonine-4-phosphate dehydrogenase PdxA [Magnetospirillum sp. WYHS-4]